MSEGPYDYAAERDASYGVGDYGLDNGPTDDDRLTDEAYAALVRKGLR